MRIGKILPGCLLLLSLSSCSTMQENKDKVIENKIETLLSKMTLEEKIGQMNQISSLGNIEEMSVAIKKGEIGSILNEIDPVRVNALQRVAVEESRMGIPLLIARDVIHGFKTIFPIPLALACTWDPALIEKTARRAIVEATSTGINWVYSPMVDISRDPRWGSRSRWPTCRGSATGCARRRRPRRRRCSCSAP